MENRIFRICISFDPKKKPLTLKLFYISIFTSNHFQTELQTRRERERERERERARIDRAPIRQPQTELQSDDPHRADRTSFVDRSTAPIAPVSSITALRRSSKDRLQRRTISPSSCDLAFASAARSCL